MDNLLDNEHKIIKVFPVPYKHVAIEFVVDKENTIYGMDIDGSNYIGKIGENFQVSLIEFNNDNDIKGFNGMLDLSSRILVGEWLDVSSLNDIITKMLSYSDKSVFEMLPDDSLKISKFLVIDEKAKIKMKKYLNCALNSK